MGTSTYTQVYSRTHSIVFLSDNLSNTLREVDSRVWPQPRPADTGLGHY